MPSDGDSDEHVVATAMRARTIMQARQAKQIKATPGSLVGTDVDFLLHVG